ncbi:MAG: ATP-binding protein, partial [Candidatus Omnitrophota bacterium]
MISYTRRIQLKYVFLAFMIALPGSMDYIAKFGIEIYPAGYFFMFLFISVVAYAIVRYRLMDIDVIVKKTIVFSGLFISVCAIFAGFIFGGVVFCENILGNNWIALIPAILVAIFTLHPLEVFLKKNTDHFLFQKRYDFKNLLNSFAREVLSVLDVDKLAELTARKIAEIIKLDNAIIFLNDEKRKFFFAGFNIDMKRDSDIDHLGDTLINFFHVNKTREFVSENMTVNGYRAILKNSKSVLAVPLTMTNRLVGVLSLGAKKSDEDFTEDDISILLPICKTLAIAIANAELIKKLTEANARAAQNEKMAVIGMLSAGINHEICNPLGIARGKCESFLSNAREGFYRGEDPEELIKKAEGILESVIAETDRAAVITKRLSSFASPATGEDVEDVDINNEIERVLEFLRYEIDVDRIAIEKRAACNIPRVTADPKGIQEIFFNILRNAVQAIEGDGKIEIDISRDGEDVSVCIRDSGKGMSRRVKDRIFSPFFTTKSREKGTGLGLFIVKQIAARNNGSIK